MRNLKFFPCLFLAILFLGNISVRANISKRTLEEVNLIYGPHKNFSVPFLDEKNELKAAAFAPTITQQPTDKSTCAGETIVFTVEAQGSGLSYQWWANTGYGWFALGEYEYYSGTSTKNLVIKNFNFYSAQPGYPLYRVVVSDASGATTSNTVRLYQNTPASGGWMNAAYADRTVCAGQNTFFTATSSYSAPIQWEVSKDGGTIWSDVINDSHHIISSNRLDVVNVPVSMNNYFYRAKVATGSCPLYGHSSKLTVTTPIVNQPSNQSVSSGSNAIFSATTTGTGLSFRWQMRPDISGTWTNLSDGAAYSGSFTQQLTVNNTQLSQSGQRYRLVISRSDGGCTSTSNEVTLTVKSAATACGYSNNTFNNVTYTPCINFPSRQETVTTNMTVKRYFLMNVIQGLTYQVYTGNTTAPSSQLALSIFREGATSDAAIVYSAQNTGNPATLTSRNAFVSFTPSFSGQVRVLLNVAGNCAATSPSGIIVYSNVIGGSNTLDIQQGVGLNDNTWLGHIYDGTNQGIAASGNFSNYIGNYAIGTETFNQSFNGDAACFPVFSNASHRANIYTETFSVRYRMNSTRRGFYVVDLGSDDGTRLTVDGNLVFNNWAVQAYTARPQVLMSLKGNSQLVYDFYENGGGNQVSFENVQLILENSLTQNVSQTISLGSTGQAISGDTFGTLPTGISRTGTGYQWSYSTTQDGDPIDITGATGATFTPNSGSAPFNAAGTYYLFRKAKLTSSNNTGITSYEATNLSNAAILTVTQSIPTACSYNQNSTSPLTEPHTPCIDIPYRPNLVSNMAVGQHFVINVIKGLTYEVATGNTTAPPSQLSLTIYKDQAPTESAIAYSYQNTGNSNSTNNNVYISFTPSFSGRVRVFLNVAGNCAATTPTNISVYSNISGGSNTQDDPLASGTDNWIGHIYDGTNQAVGVNETFNNYIGTYSEFETFSQFFGGVTACFPISSNNSVRANIYTESFSTRYRMNSTRKGLYSVDLGTDNGTRLSVDGSIVYSNWVEAYPDTTTNVLIRLTGQSTLVYDYFEVDQGNNVMFNNLIPLIENNLTENTNQTITRGNTGQPIAGDTFGTLPTGISKVNTGYQWFYSTTPGGVPSSIGTGATFTPNTASAPFNVPGTYYIYRLASLHSVNNTGITEYQPTLQSNTATITVTEPISTACGYANNSFNGIIDNTCINFENPDYNVISNMAVRTYFEMDVIQGLDYHIYTGNTSAPSNQLSLSIYRDGADTEPAIAYSSENNGNPFTAVNNNVYVSFTASFSGKVRVLLNVASDCSATTPTDIAIYRGVTGGTNTLDNQLATATDGWIGHIYDGTSFNNYLGYYTEPTEVIDQGFGGELACFPITSDGILRGSVLTETFSVRYRMNSTRDGLYTVNMGADDGGRLYVDDSLVYNNWAQQDYTTSYKSGILLSLNSSELLYEYFEGPTNNRVTFSEPQLVFSNDLTANTDQTVCIGCTSNEISGNTIPATLPGGINIVGSGYQWTYSLTPDGDRINIEGATQATFTPDVSTAPFNSTGTYYLFRNSILSSANNYGATPSPYIATHESNTATLTVTEPSGFITKHPQNQNICVGTAASFSVETFGTGLSYQWERNTGSGWTAIADGTNYSGTTSSTITVSSTDLTMDGHQFRVAVTDGATVDISNAAILQVSNNSGQVITLEGSDKSVCPGASTFFEVITTETYSYQWQVSNDGGATFLDLVNGTYYNNVNSKRLDIINTPSSFHTNLYRVAVTQGGCTGYSNALKLTLPTRITSQPISQSGSTWSSVTYVAGVAGTNLSYQWHAIEPGSTWPLKDDKTYSGTRSTSFSVQEIQDWMEQRSFRLQVTDNNTGCTFYSNEVYLYVDNPLSNNIISEDQEYCGATNAKTLTGTNVRGGTSSSYTYLWESSTTSATSGFAPAAGTNSTASYSPGILSQTTWFRRTVSSGTYAPNTSNVVQITVNSVLSWTGNTSTDWNTASNWSCNSLPTLATDVLIPAGLTNYPILSSGSNGLAKNITIDTGASIEVNANQLQIAGMLTNSGTLNVQSGSMAFVGSTAQIIPLGAFATNRIQNLTINNTAGVTSQAIIELTGILKVENGNFETGGNFTLISDAVQTALIDGSGSGEVTGLVDMQRFMDVAFGYKYFSSPVQLATVGDFSPYVDLGAVFPNFYRYDENREITTPIADTLSTHASGWEAYTTSTSALNTMEGYAVNFGSTTGPVTVEITGEVNNGTFSKTLANNNKQYTKGFHLVGNPYPSPIDWDVTSGWTKTNIDNGIYFFTAGSTNRYTGTYTSYVDGIASDGKASNIIPSMQGFFIKVSDSDTGTYPVNGTLGMTNTIRINNFSQPFLKTREPELKPLLRLSAGFGNTGTADAMVIYFSPQSSTDFEKEKDAHKIMNTDVSVPNLYSISTDKKQLSISGLPFPDARDYTKIPLGIKAEKNGKMTITLQDIQNLPLNFNVYLIDQEKKIGQNLMEDSSYSFSIERGENNNRFHLIFSEENITDTAIAFDEPFSLETGQGSLKVRLNLEDGQKGTLRASAVTGQILQVKEGTGQETVEFSAITSPGVYFINLYVGDRQFSKKVLIKN